MRIVAFFCYLIPRGWCASESLPQVAKDAFPCAFIVRGNLSLGFCRGKRDITSQVGLAISRIIFF